MSESRPVTGALGDRYPFVRVGDGPRDLVVVPGIDDAMFDGDYPTAAAWWLRGYFSRYLDEHTLYLLSRPRGLPDGETIPEMADGYADVIGDALGSVDVVGLSMGGMIAQDLAVRHPDLVDRLVVANSGCRFPNREAGARVREYATDRDWAAIRAELARAMFADWRALAYPPLALTMGRVALPRPADPGDVTASIEAIMAFDSRDRLGEIETPTLVFGGSEDPYFPESVLAETAAGIPDASKTVLRGARHAAFHERKPQFDSRVRSFLRNA